MHPGPITYRRGCCCPSLLTLHQDAPAPAQDAQIALITGAPQPYKSNRGRSQCGGIPRGVWGVSIYHLGCPPCGLELTSTTRLTIGISSTTWLMNVPHITNHRRSARFCEDRSRSLFRAGMKCQFESGRGYHHSVPALGLTDLFRESLVWVY